MSWSTSELRVKLVHRYIVLSPPVKYFTDRSKAVFLLWIFYGFFLSCVCYAIVCVCLYVPCGHLLGKGWPLGSRLWCLAVSLLLSHWYPGSGMILDCIDSWSLHPYLLCMTLEMETWENIVWFYGEQGNNPIIEDFFYKWLYIKCAFYYLSVHVRKTMISVWDSTVLCDTRIRTSHLRPISGRFTS